MVRQSPTVLQVRHRLQRQIQQRLLKLIVQPQKISIMEMLRSSNFRVSESNVMNFPESDYQRQLIVASLDDFTPNATLPNFLGGQFGATPENWRRAVVNFLCLNVNCGLIEATHRPEISAHDSARFLAELLSNGDVGNNIPVDVLWDVLYFNGTGELKKIVESVGMCSWNSISSPPNRDFVGKLTEIYENFVKK